MLFSAFEDISKGVETCQVSANREEIKLEDISSFVYIRKNIPGPGTKLDNFEDEFEGCQCNVQSCSTNKCECIGLFGVSYDENKSLFGVNPYERAMKPILECNKNCSCNKSCRNRVVQHGVQYKLHILLTKRKGLGLQTLQTIKANSFVCEYAGEVLNECVARQRSELLKPEDCNYILALREYTSHNKVEVTYVDPTYIGNVGRFINHSCEPNLYMVPVRVECNVPVLALFALRHIEKGEELTYDYSGEIKKRKPSQNMDATENHKQCFCGANYCSGVLPFDHTLYKS